MADRGADARRSCRRRPRRRHRSRRRARRARHGRRADRLAELARLVGIVDPDGIRVGAEVDDLVAGLASVSSTASRRWTPRWSNATATFMSSTCRPGRSCTATGRMTARAPQRQRRATTLSTVIAEVLEHGRRRAPTRRSARSRSSRPRRRPTCSSRARRRPRPRAAPSRRAAAPRRGSRRLRLEELPARHRDDASVRRPAASSCCAAASATCTSEPVAMQDQIRRAVRLLGLPEHVGAARDAVARRARCVERRQLLPRERERDRAVLALERDLPGADRLVRVGGPDEPEVRDRAQRRVVLDRLVRRPVLAEPDRVVRPDADDRDAATAPTAGPPAACSRRR